MTLTKKDGEGSKTRCAQHILALWQQVSTWRHVRIPWGAPGLTPRDPDFISLGKVWALVTFSSSPEPMLQGNWKLHKSTSLVYDSKPSQHNRAVQREIFLPTFYMLRARRGGPWPQTCQVSHQSLRGSTKLQVPSLQRPGPSQEQSHSYL